MPLSRMFVCGVLESPRVYLSQISKTVNARGARSVQILISEDILLQLYDRFHLTPRLLAAFGEQRDRFRGADELQKYSGIAPVTERSSKKCWAHWRWQCPTFLRQTFVEWAGQTINKSFWAGAYYRQQRAKGSSYQAAVRALAFKWIRILYRCWQTGTQFKGWVNIRCKSWVSI